MTVNSEIESPVDRGVWLGRFPDLACANCRGAFQSRPRCCSWTLRHLEWHEKQGGMQSVADEAETFNLAPPASTINVASTRRNVPDEQMENVQNIYQPRWVLALHPPCCPYLSGSTAEPRGSGTATEETIQPRIETPEMCHREKMYQRHGVFDADHRSNVWLLLRRLRASYPTRPCLRV